MTTSEAVRVAGVTLYLCVLVPLLLYLAGWGWTRGSLKAKLSFARGIMKRECKCEAKSVGKSVRFSPPIGG
jgi:hypothetical protein